jgi:hypothetical protein
LILYDRDTIYYYSYVAIGFPMSPQNEIDKQDIKYAKKS